MKEYLVPGVLVIRNPKELMLDAYVHPAGEPWSGRQISPKETEEIKKTRTERIALYLDMAVKVLKAAGLAVAAVLVFYALFKGVISLAELIPLLFQAG